MEDQRDYSIKSAYDQLSVSGYQKEYQKSRQGFPVIALLILLVSCLVTLSGCSKRYGDMPAYSGIPLGNGQNYSVGRFKTAYLADQIDYYYRGSANGPIGVTTVVNLDDLYTTSSFGRMVAEQMMSELAMRGFDVIELRQADALQFLSDAGEFGLSRDVGVVRNARDLVGIVVGTYVDSPERVYVNMRLIEPASSVIVSAGSIELVKTREIAKMMRNSSLPPSLERIPVRHIAQATFPLAMFPQHVRNYYDLEENSYAPPRAPETVGAPPAPEFGPSSGKAPVPLKVPPVAH
jgi:TolB-like protein